MKYAKSKELGPVKMISAGWQHSLCLTENGELWGCGSNEFGQLGVGDWGTYFLLEKITFDFRSPIKKMIAAHTHSVVLTEDGKVFAFGENSLGQCGVSRKYKTILTPQRFQFEEKIIDIATGMYHTILLTESGKILAAGSNANGQFGKKGVESGRGFKEIDIFPGKAAKIFAGGQSTIVILDSGHVYVAGDNRKGQLGLGKVTIQQDFVALNLKYKKNKMPIGFVMGQFHTIGWREDGVLMVSGSDEQNQLAGKSGKQLVLSEFKLFRLGKRKVVDVSTSDYHVIALTDDKKCVGWGMGSQGQLSRANITEKKGTQTIPLQFGVSLVSAGGCVSLFVSEDKKLYGVGNNSGGMLAVKNISQSNYFDPVRLAITADGSLKPVLERLQMLKSYIERRCDVTQSDEPWSLGLAGSDHKIEYNGNEFKVPKGIKIVYEAALRVKSAETLQQAEIYLDKVDEKLGERANPTSALKTFSRLFKGALRSEETQKAYKEMHAIWTGNKNLDSSLANESKLK